MNKLTPQQRGEQAAGGHYLRSLGEDHMVDSQALYHRIPDMERLFHAAWFTDFRERWQDDLKREHLNFVARLEVVVCGSCSA